MIEFLIGLQVGWLIVALIQSGINRKQAKINVLTHNQIGAMLVLIDILERHTDLTREPENDPPDWGPGV